MRATSLFKGGETNAHRDIFLQSLPKVNVNLNLRKDVYGLRDPGLKIYEIRPPEPDPLARAKYACVFWIDHLHDSRSVELHGEDLLRFLSVHFLHWLESLSLLG